MWASYDMIEVDNQLSSKPTRKSYRLETEDKETNNMLSI